MSIKKIFTSIVNTSLNNIKTAKDEIINTQINKSCDAAAQEVLANYNQGLVNVKQNAISNKTYEQKHDELVNKIKIDENIDDDNKENIILSINEENIDLANQMYCDEDFPKKEIRSILRLTNKENIQLATQMCNDKDFPKNAISSILFKTFINKEILNLTTQICNDKDFPKDEIYWILYSIDKENLNLATQMCNDKDFPKDKISFILGKTNKENINLVTQICNDKDFPKDEIFNILRKINEENIQLITKMCTDKDFPKKEIHSILSWTNKENLNLATQMCNDKDFPRSKISDILFYTNKKNLNLATQMCTDKNFPKKEISFILKKTNDENIQLANQLCADKDFPKDEISSILSSANKDNLKQAEKLINDWENKKIPAACISYSLCGNDLKNPEIQNVINEWKLGTIPENCVKYTVENYWKLNEIKTSIEQWQNSDIPENIFPVLLEANNNISYSDIKKFKHIVSGKNANKFDKNDLKIILKLPYLYEKQNINEIPLSEKRNTVRNLISYNADLFEISNELKKQFPLIPTNQEEYCALLPALVKSLGIETNPLTEDENNKLDVALNDLSTSLASISDSDFNEMTINQEYPKSAFINDTFNIVKDLSPSERQKVYDYFGFELHKNKNGNSVDNSKYNFSIVGYPVNLNNGKKLAQIDDEKTKQVVEQLRPYVIHFSENNKISCSDENIEASLNEVVKAFPELRCEIDKLQHSTQDFDVMKHSLKVIQKITQNPEFNKLNKSDKKILLLSSLFHDINKSEGTRDGAHADESAFDTFYISNKLNLSRDEKVKLYSLCKSHEWLNYVNNDKLTPDEQEKRLQSVAFDLQYDNLFEMAKIFTEGDLKSVKNDNSFFDKHCNALETNSQKIDNYINELKKSQPLLPVTKLPTASRIEEAITQVNKDGSTNIKGVYKDKSGVVVLKYNEIEDWEKIGFPSGSSSKGINATAIKGTGKHTKEKEIETGNIKFFAHGLDFENQLSKFDAFALPDSDALLSVSYAERPESKYRFFRTQGVLLDVNTKYIFGGGNTDKGSGCKKDVKNFKDNYIFGGEREEDRLYISNLIKENLNLNDEEYVKFVNENKNKSLTEIEPEEIRTKLIQAFATINSNVRKGEREYNEMYVTNPRVMGVFAYSPENKIGDINNFMDTQEDFLKQYAKDNNLPFVIFGD
jgi:hypothetical protein